MKTKLLLILLSFTIFSMAQLTEVTTLNPPSEAVETTTGIGFLTEMNGELYFVNDGLRKTDGTNAGTSLVYNGISINTSGSSFLTLQEMNNQLYFTGEGGPYGRELWKSDGTNAGTQIVADINIGTNNSIETYDVAITDNNLIFFAANNGDGTALWKSNGTEMGTNFVKKIEPAITNDDIRSMYTIGNNVYFPAFTNNEGLELWKSDGTNAGTVLVKDIHTGTSSADPSHFYADGNTLYFAAVTADEGTELWKTDGTEAGTVLVKDIYVGTTGSQPRGFFTYNGFVYFSANSLNKGFELWRTDGTEAGTTLVKDIYPGTGNSMYVGHSFAIANNELYFVARESYAAGRSIWKTDGTETGTVKVGGQIVTNSSQDTRIISYHEKIYFTGYDADHHNELWECGGTTATTQMVMDINPGTDPSYIYSGYYVYDDALYFSAFKPDSGRELWRLYTTYSPPPATTSIPDTNFETYLETHNAAGDVVVLGATDSMGNGISNDQLVFTSRIESVTHLNVFNKNIADLTGIENFTELIELRCNSNDLTALDITTNTNLARLYASYNDLTSLDVTYNTNLTLLEVYNNDLTSLDVSNNSNLTILYVTFNELVTIDVTNNPNLIYLNCGYNNLTALDVSSNTDVTFLNCASNSLTSLNTTNSANLESLICGNNNLTTLDVSNNTNLTDLYCESNSLISLNLNNNTSLNKLDCRNNNLTSLNIQNGYNDLLEGTYTVGSNTYSYFQANENPSLTCIFVDNATNATAGSAPYTDWSIDETANFVQDQAACDTLFATTDVPDDNFEAYLETHNAAGDTVALGATDSMGNGIANDDLVFTARIDTVTILNVSNLNIADLTGVEDFVALIQLECNDNIISFLELNTNQYLEIVNCTNNSLTTLNIQNYYNYLLEGTYTDGSNSYARFRATNNPNLTCVFVDYDSDAAAGYAPYTDWEIDATATYVSSQYACDALIVPDETIIGLSMYPNPVNNKLHLTALDKITSVSIYNMLGQEVKQSTPFSTSTSINMTAISNGVYVIKVQVGDQIGLYNIIKK